MKTLLLLSLLLAVPSLNSLIMAKPGTAITSIYINTPDSSVHAYITTQTSSVTAKNGYTYYWYTSNQLCHTDGGYAGRLLHGKYSSYYPNHFLLSQGEFRMGLKDGCWKTWFADGTIHEILQYKKGKLHGAYEIYSSSGILLTRMYFRNGVRAGKTKIFSQGKPDSVIQYKNGVPVESQKNTNRVFRKKRSTADSVASDSMKTTPEKQRNPPNDSATTPPKKSRKQDSARKEKSKPASPEEQKPKKLRKWFSLQRDSVKHDSTKKSEKRIPD